MSTEQERKDHEAQYNGWKNYPTWAVNLWLSNDESLDANARGVVRYAMAHPYEFRMKGDTDRTGEVATALQVFVEDLCPDLGASFSSDLLAYALAQVDWYEIAKAWMPE